MILIIFKIIYYYYNKLNKIFDNYLFIIKHIIFILYIKFCIFLYLILTLYIYFFNFYYSLFIKFYLKKIKQILK